jgi:hypothetical protein
LSSPRGKPLSPGEPQNHIVTDAFMDAATLIAL